MKSMKKLVLAALILLASVVGLLSMAGCKNDSVPEVPKYTVKFETEHGTAPASITVESGTKLTAEQLKALLNTEDNIFEGWYDGETQAKGGEYTVTKDVTLVAKWRNRDTVASVTFAPSSTKLYYGETVTVTLATATEDATIKYRLADSEDWQDYNEAITITSDTTITAYATKAGLKDSTKTTATYTVRKLTKISITPPTRTVYSVGESFDDSDMVVTATYEDGETRKVTGWTTNFDEVTREKGVNKKVTVSYTEGEIKKQSSFTVVVFPEGVKILTDYTSPNHTDNTWTYVAFGEWPQSEVKDFSPKTAATSYGIFKDNYYEEDDGKYVKVNDKYFKVEPIIWRVLNSKDGEYNESENPLLLAENILTGGIPYYVDSSWRTIAGDTVYPNNYKYSTIRAWLNGKYEDDDTQEKSYTNTGFLQTAFTENAQKEIIVDTEVDNSARSTSDAEGKLSQATDYACVNTTDKIFLLSEQEATKSDYVFAVYNAYGQDNTRIRVTTDYAKATGAYQDGYGGWWWLRSPHCDDEYSARLIGSDGNAFIISSIVDSILVGVVPALSISLQ